MAISVLKLFTSVFLNGFILSQISLVNIQFLSVFRITANNGCSMWLPVSGYHSAVACSQFDKLKLAILDIRQQHITPHHQQEDEQVHKTANSDLQAKLNACIRHHHDIIE